MKFGTNPQKNFFWSLTNLTFTMGAVWTLVSGCVLRQTDSETKGAGSAWCATLPQQSALIYRNRCARPGPLSSKPKLCTTAYSEGIDCSQLSVLPTLFEPLSPSDRVSFLKTIPDVDRAQFSKKFEFLIPEDVRPRLDPSTYVDAYIKAVGRLQMLSIPAVLESDGYDKQVTNTNKYMALSDDSSLQLFNTQYVSKMPFLIYRLPVSPKRVFSWKNQICTIFDKGFLNIVCYQLQKQNSDCALPISYIGFFESIKLGNKDIFVVLDNNELLLLQLDDQHWTKYWKINLETKVVLEQDLLAPKVDTNGDKYISIGSKKIYLYKRNYFYTAPNPSPIQENFSNLVGEYILDGMFIGGTDHELVVLEKKGDSYATIKKQQIFYDNPQDNIKKIEVYHKIEKLTGGFIALKTTILGPPGSRVKKNLRVLDIWAP